MRLWDVAHVDGLLTGREDNEAYAIGKPGQHYVVYFTDGGAAGLNSGPGRFLVRWMDVNSGEWGPRTELRSDGMIALAAPAKGNWLAIIAKQ